MTSTIARPDRGITASGPLLYLTEPARAAVDFGLLTTSAPLLAALPRGDGHPVLVLPGLGATDSSTITLRAVLRRLGYRTYRWRLGRNIGPTQRAVHGTRARLDQLTTRFGQPVSLIASSLGGIYARQLARRTGHAVRQVITLGSPIRLARKGRATPIAWSAITLIGTSRPGTCLSNTGTAHCRCPRPRSTHRWTASSRGGPA